jgi:hypothetical protein
MIDRLGDYIAEGFRRIVYNDKDNPFVVIKFLKDIKDEHNKIEFENWEKLKDTEKGKWLVPCISISEDGRYLVQEKVEIIDEPPDDIPNWIKNLGDYSFGGNKSKHWGMLNNKVVLVDYGDKKLWNI